MDTPRDVTSLGRRRSLTALWRLIRWPLVGVLALAAFVLGYVGFGLHFDELGTSRSIADRLYLTLQLFALQSGDLGGGPVPWQLEIARVLAPATTATALVTALLAVFREELEELRLRRMRGHVVVVGLGARGTAVTKALAGAGRRVVAIERDHERAQPASMRRLGVPVLIGDARDSEVLGRAGVGRAAHLIALTGADDTNSHVALGAGDLVVNRRGRALSCLAHIRDPDLCVMLRSGELAADRELAFRLDFFNVYDQAARAWLEQMPTPSGPDGAAHAIVIGLNTMGQSLVVETARRWAGISEAPLVVSLVDLHAADITDQLHRRFPQLGHMAKIDTIEADAGSVTCEVLHRAQHPTVVYVCADDDSVALETAISIRGCSDIRSAPVIVQLTESTAMAQLLARSGDDGLQPLLLLEEAMSPELLIGGTYETLARAIHADYVRHQEEDGETADTNPSMRPWDELPDSLKESNRDQAAHIGSKLRAVECGLALLADWNAAGFEFSPDEVELLAELEHERWMEQRLRDGWKRGVKDPDKKTSLCLVGWEDLSEDIKELDRQAVRGIPRFLAEAGYQIVRRPPTS